jgi:DNA-binding transcriptional ArsR family regulator
LQNVLWFLIAGSRGGEARARILKELKRKPANAHQLSLALDMDYKTVQYHLGVLEENGALTVVKKGGYGATYFLSDELKQNWAYLESIW